MGLRRLKISLEDVDGSKQQEIEYTIFAKVDNWDWIELAASSEIQEQWESYRDQGGGRFSQCRVRAIDDKTYHACVKAKRPGEMGKAEVEQVCSKDYFEIFKEFADKGLRKIRYFFPVAGTDLKWEVDVYMTDKGERIDWVKLDLEVTDPETRFPELPFEPAEAIMNQDSKRTPAEREFICKLFEAYSLKFVPGE